MNGNDVSAHLVLCRIHVKQAEEAAGTPGTAGELLIGALERLHLESSRALHAARLEAEAREAGIRG
jgi:hypothetical protein